MFCMTLWQGHLHIGKVRALLSFPKVNPMEQSKLGEVLVQGVMHLQVVQSGRYSPKPKVWMVPFCTRWIGFYWREILSNLWLLHIWRGHHKRQPEGGGRSRRAELDHLHFRFHLKTILAHITGMKFTPKWITLAGHLASFSLCAFVLLNLLSSNREVSKCYKRWRPVVVFNSLYQIETKGMVESKSLAIFRLRRI